MRKVALVLVGLALMVGVEPAEVVAQADTAVVAMMESLKQDGGLSLGDEQVVAVEGLPEIYATNGNALIWTDPGAAGKVIECIEEMRNDGLNPADYHLAALTELGVAAPSDPDKMAQRDVLFTDAYFLMLYHLIFGKADPNRLDQDWNLNSLYEELDPGDEQTRQEISAEMLNSVKLGDPCKLLEWARPDWPLYSNLRDGYRLYRDLAVDGGWPTVPDGPTIREGDTDPRVAVIRRRLTLTQDYAGEDSASEFFDSDLAGAVAGFQRRHGLEADGVVGKKTVAAMNVPAEERVDQIRVNLERARWALQLDVGDDGILVNIASYDTWLFRDDVRIWHARVQVGKPFTRTPVFSGLIKYLEFNPNWTVPASIANRSYLAKIKADPGFLASKDMVLLDSKGNEVDPATVDWASATRVPYTIRQMPGPQNALGRVKFIFPNKHAVYLHDTPSRQNFSLDARAFSSGCIRVQNPLDLAALLLDDQSKWTPEYIHEVVESGKRTTVNLTRPLPVLLLYMTAYSMDEGDVRFREDLYERDPAILEVLDGPVLPQARHQR